MKDSSSCQDVQIPNYHLRSWVESITVTNAATIPKNNTRIPVGLLDGSKRYLMIGTTLRFKPSLSLRELVCLTRLLKRYPTTSESLLLQRVIAIIYLLTTQRFKRFSMLVTVVVLYPKWRLRGNTMTPSTFPSQTTRYGI